MAAIESKAPGEIERWNAEDALDLARPGAKDAYDVTVGSKDWTVGTIIAQVNQGNIDLDPAFQRRNAWHDARRSRLIESFILRFPVPQIVLAEDPHKKGAFIVIDGKQRLMTIAGLGLEDYRDYWTRPQFSGLEVLTELNGVGLDEFHALSKYADMRRRMENADIRTTLLTGFKSEGVLYDIFYRINTGSVPLSSQELRHALHRGPFAKYLLEVTSEENAIWRLLGATAPDPRLRDVELLLRLIAWRRNSASYAGNMKRFLDQEMNGLNRSWAQSQVRVKKLVTDLMTGTKAAEEVFGEDLGRKFKDGKFEAHLNRAVFEVQVFYLSSSNIAKAALAKRKKVREASRALFGDAEFLASVEATTKSIANYRTRFGKYRTMLAKQLGVEVPAVRVATASQ